MKVSNMTSEKTGRAIPNQYIIFDSEFTMFQSYDSNIVKIYWEDGERVTALDENYWNYSTTTGKYRNQFLGETIAQTRKKIKSGEYILSDLN